MTTIEATKSNSLNWAEGFALTAILQGFPIFAATPMIVKLMGDTQTINPVIFVIITTTLYALLTIWAGPRFPRIVRHGYEPLFFDESLSFSEKIARWREKPATSVQLITSVLLLSLLATFAI